MARKLTAYEREVIAWYEERGKAYRALNDAFVMAGPILNRVIDECFLAAFGEQKQERKRKTR